MATPTHARDVATHAVEGRVDPDDDKYAKRRSDFLGMPVAVLKERCGVLVGLMVVQSLSGIVLSQFEDLIRNHMVVTLFLTMLVGAGGNAGNQSTVSVIRGLATGEITRTSAASVVLLESKMGFVLGLALATVASLRVVVSGGDAASAAAIGASVLCIVSISTLSGAALPILLDRAGIDAAHAGPAIQVVMDILGVTITCVICTALFAALGRE